MANDSIGKLEDRLAKQVADRNEQLDQLRNLLSELAAQQRETIARNGALASRVDALERVPVPGFLALWGPAVATAALLAGGFGFILDQRDKPLDNEIQSVKAGIIGNSHRLESAERRQFDVNRELGEIRYEVKDIRRQVNAIDARGARAPIE